MSLNEIQEKLVEESMNNCTSALRNLVATKNAISGLAILQDHWDDAFANYQSTLAYCKSVDATRGVKTDTFQIIHCLWNALECCKVNPELLSAEQQAEYLSELTELQNHFLAKAEEKLAKAVENVTKCEFKTGDLDAAFDTLRAWAKRLNFNSDFRYDLKEFQPYLFSAEDYRDFFRKRFRRCVVRTRDPSITRFLDSLKVGARSRGHAIDDRRHQRARQRTRDCLRRRRSALSGAVEGVRAGPACACNGGAGTVQRPSVASTGSRRSRT